MTPPHDTAVLVATGNQFSTGKDSSIAHKNAQQQKNGASSSQTGDVDTAAQSLAALSLEGREEARASSSSNAAQKDDQQPTPPPSYRPHEEEKCDENSGETSTTEAASAPIGWRRSGRVKFFNSTKGYGFIIPNDPTEINVNGRNEIFVHHTAISNGGGFKSLGEGEEVEYDLVSGSKGLQAASVSGPNGRPVLGDSGLNSGAKHAFHANIHRSNNKGGDQHSQHYEPSINLSSHSVFDYNSYSNVYAGQYVDNLSYMHHLNYYGVQAVDSISATRLYPMYPDASGMHLHHYHHHEQQDDYTGVSPPESTSPDTGEYFAYDVYCPPQPSEQSPPQKQDDKKGPEGES